MNVKPDFNAPRTLSDELAYTSAAELAGRIRRRDLSSVEVVEAFIKRIEARNPSLNALVYLGFDDARARAREAERAMMAGEELGPLHGVPRRSRTSLISSRVGRPRSAAYGHSRTTSLTPTAPLLSASSNAVERSS
jgi:hypothetical protein